MTTPTQGWQIYAIGEHYQAAGEPLPDLKALTQAATGKAFRRIGRFIQLALIGASRCAQHQSLPRDTAVYFASGRGDLELTLDIMTQLFREGNAPKPLSFVNTVSNAACFYLAQHLGLQSRSNFVCNRYVAFESVLQLALLDLQLGNVDSALVGSVDIATSPLSEHRQRLHLLPDTPVGEGSHWLWLGPPNPQRPRVGDVIAAQHLVDRDALMNWMRQQKFDARCRIAAGQFMQPKDFAAIQAISGLQTFTVDTQRGYYDSHSGAVICDFLRQRPGGGELLHINADETGRYSIVWMRH